MECELCNEKATNISGEWKFLCEQHKVKPVRLSKL